MCDCSSHVTCPSLMKHLPCHVTLLLCSIPPLHMLSSGAVLHPCSAKVFEAATTMPKPIHLPEPVGHLSGSSSGGTLSCRSGRCSALIVFQCMWLPHFITEGQEHGLRPIQLLSRARSADHTEPVNSLALYHTQHVYERPAHVLLLHVCGK